MNTHLDSWISTSLLSSELSILNTTTYKVICIFRSICLWLRGSEALSYQISHHFQAQWCKSGTNVFRKLSDSVLFIFKERKLESILCIIGYISLTFLVKKFSLFTFDHNSRKNYFFIVVQYFLVIWPNPLCSFGLFYCYLWL